MLFIEMAMLLWAFDIELPTGADGQPILPDRFGIVDHGVTVYVPVSQPHSLRKGPVSDFSEQQLAEAVRRDIQTTVFGRGGRHETRAGRDRCARTVRRPDCQIPEGLIDIEPHCHVNDSMRVRDAGEAYRSACPYVIIDYSLLSAVYSSAARSSSVDLDARPRRYSMTYFGPLRLCLSLVRSSPSSRLFNAISFLQSLRRGRASTSVGRPRFT
jgi:hypothetical protein